MGSRGSEVSVQETEDCLVRGDAGRLQQVVWNLLSNAIKFTPPGGSITVTVGIEERQVVLAVADTGAGIPREFLPHVFDRFRQADQTSTRVHGGLGLGLSISRSIVLAHGGRLWGVGTPGRGATFHISLPAVGP